MAKSGSGGTVAITRGAQTAQTTVELDDNLEMEWKSLELLAIHSTFVAISSDAVTDSDAGGTF